ncbi:hypothetical protein SAMN05444743_1511 [Pseudomonas sp. PDC86]|nr:hypothetical protein SAMN05444743_1511 [Pseudomonas sp. PDC86]
MVNRGSSVGDRLLFSPGRSFLNSTISLFLTASFYSGF